MAEFNSVADSFGADERAGVVDVLHVQSTAEYIEYNRNFAGGQPDYTFEISNITTLIHSGESELLGDIFDLPNVNFLAQIKCSVNFSHIKLSLAVYSLPDHETSRRMHTHMMAVIEQPSETTTDDNNIVLVCNVGSPVQRYFGRFYTFCHFNCVERIKKTRGDSLVIHVWVKNVFEEIAGGVLRWKLDCSNMDIMHDLGVSPFFYAEPEGFQVQMRLFIRGQQLAAEFRFLKKKSDVNTKEKFSLKLSIMNPRDARLCLVLSFTFNDKYTPECMHSFTADVIQVQQLASFLTDNKLMLKLQLSEF